jgi:hypothetical protein
MNTTGILELLNEFRFAHLAVLGIGVAVLVLALTVFMRWFGSMPAKSRRDFINLVAALRSREPPTALGGAPRTAGRTRAARRAKPSA